MSVVLPEWAWQRPEVRQALRDRDIGAMLRYAQRYGGASQAKIAVAVDMTQGRVNEIINGRREVSRLDVYERIADGLDMPDDARRMLGLASSHSARGNPAFDLAAFPEVVRVYDSQASAADDIRRQAADVKELDVLAVRGLGLLALNDSLLRDTIAAGPHVRVLLLHPHCPALTIRAGEIGESAESLASGIRLAEARLRELASVCQLGVWRYRSLPTWRIIRLDRVLFASVFDTEWEGHESAAYKIMETPHGPLHRGFRRMFEALLDDAERIV